MCVVACIEAATRSKPRRSATAALLADVWIGACVIFSEQAAMACDKWGACDASPYRRSAESDGWTQQQLADATGVAFGWSWTSIYGLDFDERANCAFVMLPVAGSGGSMETPRVVAEAHPGEHTAL